MNHRWVCGCCNKQFDGLPLDVAFDGARPLAGPDGGGALRRGRIDADVCMIEAEDGRQIFVRGCLEIPIIGQDEVFIWGVWTSVSAKSFARIEELWSSPVPEDEPPLFGWFCNNIPNYPECLHLQTHLHLRNDGLRPTIELRPSEHPLFSGAAGRHHASAGRGNRHGVQSPLIRGCYQNFSFCGMHAHVIAAASLVIYHGRP